jgi:hypothetical protein
MAAEHRVLIDSFADARRTWDDLLALQPDVKAASGHLDEPDLVELEQRIEAHRMAMDMLADAVEAEPSDAPGRRAAPERRAGTATENRRTKRRLDAKSTRRSEKRNRQP